MWRLQDDVCVFAVCVVVVVVGGGGIGGRVFMLHSSVCISSDPTSWLVVRQMQRARTQRTVDGLITQSRKLQIHQPKESA